MASMTRLHLEKRFNGPTWSILSFPASLSYETFGISLYKMDFCFGLIFSVEAYKIHKVSQTLSVS